MSAAKPRLTTAASNAGHARDSRRNGEHIAGHLANSAITGLPVLIAAGKPGLSFIHSARMGRAYGKCRMKIGARIVRHGRSVAFQMAEVLVPRGLFQQILAAIATLRPLPSARC
jgi:hypothetical protein